MPTLNEYAASATSSVTFQRERWSDFYHDGKELFPLHWREIAVNQEKIVMDVDGERYAEMEKMNLLYLLSARAAGKMIGYLMAFVNPHFHYKSAGCMSFTDMYWVRPEFRNGTGLRLFVRWEADMRKLGVCQLITSTKLHQDHSRLLEALGFVWTDKTLVKVLI